MNNQKKLDKLIEKMTDDNATNKTLIYVKKKDFINKVIDDGTLMQLVASSKSNENKILDFLEALFSSYKFNEWILSVSFGTEENYFLHLAVNKFSPRFVYKVVNLLVSNDIVYLNKINNIFNYRNINGDTFMHLLLKKIIKENTPYDKRYLTEQISTLIRYGFDTDLNNMEGKNLISLLKEIGVTPKNKQILYEDEKEDINKLYKIIYKNNIKFLINELTGNEKEDKNFIENVFGDINYCDTYGSLLAYASDILYNVDINDKRRDKEYFLYCIKKLLKLGIDPNLKDENDLTFIHHVIYNIRKNFDTKFVIDLIKLSIKYGYDVNSDINIVEYLIAFLGYDVFKTEIFNIYKYLSSNGLNTVFSPVEPEGYTDDKEFIEFNTFNYNTDFLIYHLDCLGLTVEEKFKKKYFQIMNDSIKIMDSIKKSFSFNGFSDEELLIEVAESIKKNRKNNVNAFANEVTVCEVLETFKNMFIDSQKSFLNEIDKTKEKLLIKS